MIIAKNINRARKAFTLVEMLVVITIIGLLAAIAFPVTKQVLNKANATKSISNLRQVGSGLLALMIDGIPDTSRSNWFPRAGGAGEWRGEDGVRIDMHWLIAESMGLAELNGSTWVWKGDPSKSVFQDPGRKVTDDGIKNYDPIEWHKSSSYAYNVGLGTNNRGGLHSNFRGGEAPNGGMGLMSVERPSQLVLMCESNGDGKADFGVHPEWKKYAPGDHYKGGTHCFFADGHIQWLHKDSLTVLGNQNPYLNPLSNKTVSDVANELNN